MDNAISLCGELYNILFDSVQNMMSIINYDLLEPIGEDGIEGEVILVTENVESALEGIFDRVKELPYIREVHGLNGIFQDLNKKIVGLIEYIQASILELNALHDIQFNYLYQLIMIDTILGVKLKRIMRLYPNIKNLIRR